MTTTFTIKIPQNMKIKLDELARITRRSKSFLVTEAIQRYIDTENWQIAEIKKAVKEANAGHFASETRVKKVFEKWLKA